MTTGDIIEFVRGVGFPVAVAAFVLMRVEKVLWAMHARLVSIEVRLGGEPEAAPSEVSETPTAPLRAVKRG